MLLHKCLPRGCNGLFLSAPQRGNHEEGTLGCHVRVCQRVPRPCCTRTAPVCKACLPVLQEGTLRCDVNVSVRPRGRERFGTKVEVKNMNSFSAMQKAIDFEISRQVSLCAAHGAAG